MPPLVGPNVGSPDVDPMAAFAFKHPEMFDIPAQVDHTDGGWWTVAICMEHFRELADDERELLGTRLVKPEVPGDERTLLPDPTGTLAHLISEPPPGSSERSNPSALSG